MFSLRNPKKALIKDLRNSEELYKKLVSLSKENRKLQNRAYRHIKYIDEFIEYIDSLNAKQIDELLKKT